MISIISNINYFHEQQCLDPIRHSPRDPIFHSPQSNELFFSKAVKLANFITSPFISQPRAPSLAFGALSFSFWFNCIKHTRRRSGGRATLFRGGEGKGRCQIKLNDWKIMAVMFSGLKRKRRRRVKNESPAMMEQRQPRGLRQERENNGKQRKEERTLIILENKNSRLPLRMTGKCLHVLSVFYASSLSKARSICHSLRAAKFFNPPRYPHDNKIILCAFAIVFRPLPFPPPPSTHLYLLLLLSWSVVFFIGEWRKREGRKMNKNISVTCQMTARLSHTHTSISIESCHRKGERECSWGRMRIYFFTSKYNLVMGKKTNKRRQAVVWVNVDNNLVIITNCYSVY